MAKPRTRNSRLFLTVLTTLPTRTASQSKTFSTRVLIYAGFFIPINQQLII